MFAGEGVFDANAHVIEVLEERGRLLKGEPYYHAYPHCWRHKTPVIYRATPQWFISMEQAACARPRSPRSRTCAGARLGRAAHRGMIAGRPDWCLSRQRTWGVPIALFVHKATGELHPDTVALLEQVAKRWSKVASMRGLTWTRPSCSARMRRVTKSHRRAGRVVRFGRRHHAVTPGPARRAHRSTDCTWKVRISIAAGSSRC